MPIRTGDKVEFCPIPAYATQPDYIATGLVTKLHTIGGIEYALVLCSDEGMLPKLLDVRELTKIERVTTTCT